MSHRCQRLSSALSFQAQIPALAWLDNLRRGMKGVVASVTVFCMTVGSWAGNWVTTGQQYFAIYKLRRYPLQVSQQTPKIEDCQVHIGEHAISDLHV